MKIEVAILYCSGMSMNSIGKVLNVSAQTILNWIRAFALENYEKPEPSEAIVVELDELWHFIESKSGETPRRTRRINFGRNLQRQPLTQHPSAYHVITKSETVARERNNSDNRHWFARFHRRGKVLSKSEKMVYLTMALFAKFRVNGTLGEAAPSVTDSLIAQRLALPS